MVAKAVVILDPSGKPLSNCVACLSGVYSPLTNTDGYSLFGQLFSAGLTSIIIFANGYKSYVQPVTLSNENQNIIIGGTSTDPMNINLPNLSFSKPSRDSIINVQANFCNLFDAEGWPIFEPFIDELILHNMPKALDWIARLHAAGSTHLTVGFSGGSYNENLGWAPSYPIPGHDWSSDVKGFSEIVNWVKSQGFIPWIKLDTDGIVFDPNGNGVGWQWGIDNFKSVLPLLSEHFEDCLWGTGWDGCFPVWTPDQTLQMIRLLRSILGTKACIETEFGGPPTVGYCHMGGGPADWTSDKLGDLDVFSVELTSYPPDAPRIQETASRLLGPVAKNIDPANLGPFYLAGQKTKVCYMETCAYQIIRKQLTSLDAINIANQGKFYGFTSFGNGLPNV